MESCIEYLVQHYVVSEERAKALCEKHKVTGDPIAAGEHVAEEEALDPQVWVEDEDIARESDDF